MPDLPTPEDIIADVRGKKLYGDKKKFLAEFEKLTEREQNLIRILMSDPRRITQPTKLCREAGYKINSRSRASGIMKSIEGKLGTALVEQFGVTEYDMLRVHVDGIEAEKTAIVTEEHFDPETGKLIKKIPRVVSLGPDHATRQRSANVLIKLGGYEPVRSPALPPPQQHVHTLNDATLEALKAREAAQVEVAAEFEVVDG